MSEPTTEWQQEQCGTTDISETDCYRLLADEQRRVVVDVLVERGTLLTLRELVTEVSGRDGDSGRTDGERSAVELSLHHVHLPLMDDVGVIEYDRERNRVEPHTSVLERLTA